MQENLYIYNRFRPIQYAISQTYQLQAYAMTARQSNHHQLCNYAKANIVLGLAI